MRSIRDTFVLIALVVVACTPAPGPSGRPTARPSVPPTAAVSLSPAATTSPTAVPATPLPSPGRSLLPAPKLAWERVEITGLELRSVTTALSFAGAYLVFGSDSEGLEFVARSTDGRHWSTTQIGAIVEPCSGWVPRADSTVYAAASDGVHVVLAGIEDALTCGPMHAVAWISADGQTWQRSPGFGGTGEFSQATRIWPIPGGWEVLVNTASEGPRSIWRSADGLDWREVAVALPPDSDGLSVAIGAGTGGTRLMSQFNGQPGSVEVIAGLRSGESRVQSSDDGVNWAAVDIGLPIGRGIVDVSGPWPGGPAGWLLVTFEHEQPPATYVSADLRDWQHALFPRDDLERLTFTRYGYVANGNTHCPPGSGSSCDPAPAQYLSADGLTWTEFASSVGNAVIVDGPAGVLALSQPGVDVWVLPE